MVDRKWLRFSNILLKKDQLLIQFICRIKNQWLMLNCLACRLKCSFVILMFSIHKRIECCIKWLALVVRQWIDELSPCLIKWCFQPDILIQLNILLINVYSFANPLQYFLFENLYYYLLWKYNVWLVYVNFS